VRHFTQILDAVTFCRHRIGIRIFNPAGDFNRRGLNFETLALTRGCHNHAGDNNGTARCQVQNVIIVIGQRIINDGLYRIKAGTVIDGKEGDASFRISAGTHPSAHGDFLVNGDTALEYVGYRHNAHNILSVNSRKK
jgi:hypothetical protein